ncbi:peptidase [Colwellia sp. M166]|uniref:PepSY-associated TM helix domain-containing protein n=1 Tax=Colwellia sp. M166 TaxID=2583805 RepID=UPI00211DC9EC|nr:PepSY-associated TM helix domain-containing protein [Colwellia sp. M166]UUO22892.1 peptidase [Colwellia sp. M166]|tara:strand:- start:21401 stop:22000 length:600 start_codon:yes stop_codon:yes gene_type:complete
MKPSKKTLNLARLIHVYVSMALLTLLLFFSVTGITLNHPEWFSSHQAQVVESELTIDTIAELALSDGQVTSEQQQVITSEIEQAFAVSLQNTKPELMSGELFYSIKQAGKSASIAVDLETGEAFFEQTHYGWWAVLNDLHKGRNTSNFWGWIIDFSSVLFIVFAITGFILAMPQKRFHRTLIVSVSSTLLAIITIIYFA